MEPNYSCAVLLRSLWIKKGQKGERSETRKVLLFSFFLTLFIGCLTYNFMIICGDTFLGCFLPPLFNATAAFLVMRGLRGSPSLVFFPCSSSSVLGLEPSPASLFSSGCWPFSVIQRITGKGSENLTVEPEKQLLCPSQQSEIQLLHTLLLRLTFFHTPCFDAFCFPSHCSNSHLLKLPTIFSNYTSVNLE